MISLDVIFWLFIILFGIIGLMRGWAKEMLVTFAVILALFIVTVLEKYVPFVTKLVMDSTKPGGDPSGGFLAAGRAAAGAGLLRLPDPQYSANWPAAGVSPATACRIPCWASSWARSTVTWCGAPSGFSWTRPIIPSRPSSSPNLTASAKALISFLPPNWLLGVPTIFFAVAIAFAFVLVVFL